MNSSKQAANNGDVTDFSFSCVVASGAYRYFWREKGAKDPRSPRRECVVRTTKLMLVPSVLNNNLAMEEVVSATRR